jgi:hypothetical protein
MADPHAQRTLVKSPPELWAEISDVAALARHLGEFGEIRITRLEPETTVAWEGDRARGTVRLEPSGWGTKVTLTAALAQEPAQAAEAEPDPVAPERHAGKPREPDLTVAEQPEPDAPDPAGAEQSEPEPDPPEPRSAEQPKPDPPDTHAAEQPDLEPPPPDVTADEPRVGFFARLFRRRRAVGPAAVTPEPDPEPAAVTQPPEPEPDPEPTAVTPPPPEPEPAPPATATFPNRADASDRLDDERATAILTAVLDDLGSAHHRPFSRS